MEMNTFNQSPLDQLMNQSFFSSNVMNLSLVLTVQPWFLNLVNNIKENMKICQQLESTKKMIGDETSPQKILEVLGFCPCDLQLPPLNSQVEAMRKEVKADSEEFQKNSLTHDSGTKSD